jgi:thiamine biosynthesis lipoprotein
VSRRALGLLGALVLACAPGPAPPAGHISGHPVPSDEPEPPVGEKVAITRVTVAAGRPSMGTLLELTLVLDDEARGRRALEVLFRRADEYEALFTSYRSESPVNRLSAAAGRGPQPVDPRLARILGESLAFTRATQGAFDVTVGPLVDLWRDAALRGTPPSDAELASALLRVGASAVKIHSMVPTVHLTHPGMRIDLGGIAKGWTLDRLGEVLAEGGVRDALLDYGQSSILALGSPADAEAWTVALPGGEGRILGLVTLRDAGLSVSGSLGQYVEIAGVRYGHVVDPRTGRALTRNVQAAVVAPDATTAEAWSTALAVLGPEGLALVERHPGLEAHLLLEDGSQRTSSGWAAAVSWQSLD